MVTAIVQARMGSSRLPGKVLEDLDGRPVLRVLLERASASSMLDQLVVACPEGTTDDQLAELASSWGYRVFRGPLDDVFTRYLNVVREIGDDVIVRLTADCPLIDPRVIDQTVHALVSDPGCRYAHTGHGFPSGFDVEATRADVFEELATMELTASEQEHVTLAIRERADRFPRTTIDAVPNRGDLPLSVDYPEDLKVVRELVHRLGTDAGISWRDYTDALLADPELRQINSASPAELGLWRSKCRYALDEIKPSTNRTESYRYLERAARVIPHATQTMSKAVDQFVTGVSPAFLTRGLGCQVWDLDGNSYVDYPMALGPIVLGYGHPAVEAACRQQLRDGTTFTLPHPIEAEVAELLRDTVPSAEMTRFAKNGSDVTSAAIRLARAVTGRDRVLASGYHGWHDWYVGLTELRRGVPDPVAALTERLPLDSVDVVQKTIEAGDPPAAVIIELGPEGLDPEVLAALRSTCDRLGTVLIWDEIVTGFRWAPGGAQEVYGIMPDLTCLGKAMANGLPVAALTGRAELMQELRSVFFSGTFGGETVSLAAAKATIGIMRTGEVSKHIWATGEALRAGLREIITSSDLDVELQGEAPRSGLVFRLDGEPSFDLRGLFMQETVRRGVLFGGPIFVTLAHQDAHIDLTLNACSEAFAVLTDAVATDSVRERLDGEPPGVVFKPVR